MDPNQRGGKNYGDSCCPTEHEARGSENDQSEGCNAEEDCEGLLMPLWSTDGLLGFNEAETLCALTGLGGKGPN